MIEAMRDVAAMIKSRDIFNMSETNERNATEFLANCDKCFVKSATRCKVKYTWRSDRRLRSERAHFSPRERRDVASWSSLRWQCRDPRIFQASDTCANYELSRFPERRVFANMHFPACTRARVEKTRREKERGRERKYKTFPLVFTDARRFSRAISLPSRIFFRTLLAALARLMVKYVFRIFKRTRYRPRNRAASRLVRARPRGCKSENLKTCPCNLMFTGVIKAAAAPPAASRNFRRLLLNGITAVSLFHPL